MSGSLAGAEIKTFFAPDLQERFFAREEFEDLTSLVGGGMVQAYYWFRPNLAFAKPAELVAQIETTLSSRGIDYEKLIAVAGDRRLQSDVSDGLIAVMLGPGRFGIEHVKPEVDDVPKLLAAFAERAGCSALYFENLLRVFGATEHGGICVADARCDVCSVSFCKRLRYR